MKENVNVDFEEERAVTIKVPDIKITLGSVEVDFSDFKNKVAKRVAFFKSLILTEDNVKTLEAARADLNRTAKQLNDYRISYEKDFNKPFEDFKDNVKDVCDMLKSASNVLDVQIKNYEDNFKNEKISKIKELYDAIEGKPYFLTFDHVFNKKWVNKTYELSRVKQDLDLVVLKIKEDADKLVSVAKATENEVDIISNYLSALNYDNVINGISYSQALAWYHNALEKARQLKEAKERAEALEAARAEQEARKREEEIVAAPMGVKLKPAQATNNVEKRLDFVLEIKGVSKEEAIKLDRFLKENKYNYKILN